MCEVLGLNLEKTYTHTEKHTEKKSYSTLEEDNGFNTKLESENNMLSQGHCKDFLCLFA